MVKKLRIGIVGIGFGQHVLLPAFRSVQDIEILTIAATSLERAERVAKMQNIARADASWESMVNDPDLDALVIAVPPWLQEEIIAKALLQNKHLFCEKPLGLSPERTKKFAFEAKRRNLAHMVDFEFCAIPAWLAARNFIRSGSLGILKSGILNWQVETYANRMKLDHWKVCSREGGGVLLQFVSHALYNLEWLCGPIAEVFVTCTPSLDADTALHGIIKFKSNLVMSICIGSASYCGSGHCLEIYGEQGSFQLINEGSDFSGGYNFIPFERKTKFSEEKIQPLVDFKGDSRIAAVAVLARRFVHWIRTGDYQEPSFHQGHRVDLLIHACQSSHQQQRWVSLTESL
ncbi:MAG TPA: Gfo/Idh/MocA family oxidoreductase [Gammaproteobacteria bacterium]|nr:Gfo/Idh/MocA family oxidoreductase [Gammaproteobacteria bacterium]